MRIINLYSTCFGWFTFHKRKENSGTQKRWSTCGRRPVYAFSSALSWDMYTFWLPQKIRVCVFLRRRVIQPDTWYSNQGKKDSCMQCKVFQPGTRGTIRDTPPQNNMECLDAYVQIAQCVQTYKWSEAKPGVL